MLADKSEQGLRNCWDHLCPRGEITFVFVSGETSEELHATVTIYSPFNHFVSLYCFYKYGIIADDS